MAGKHKGNEPFTPGWGSIQSSQYDSAEKLYQTSTHDLIVLAQLPRAGHSEGEWVRMAKELARRLAGPGKDGR